MTVTVSPPQLSVVELQQALADARSRAAQRHAVASVTVRPAAPDAADDKTSLPLTRRGDATLVVVAAHAGAGASTVALALADAAAANGTPVRLVDCAAAGESGLTDAATEVLGVDPAGRWHRGRRGGVLIEHASAVDAATTTDEASARIAVVDAGPAAHTPRTTTATAAGVVVACQATVPGLRRAEVVVTLLGVPVVVAVIGPRKWPRVVSASLGPALSSLRREGRLVCIPLDATLAAAGLTTDALPRRVLTAARHALDVMHLSRSAADDAAVSPKELTS